MRGFVTGVGSKADHGERYTYTISTNKAGRLWLRLNGPSGAKAVPAIYSGPLGDFAPGS